MSSSKGIWSSLRMPGGLCCSLMAAVAAGTALREVRGPTLLIVGGADEQVLSFNEEALAQLGSAVSRLVIIPGAAHLFEEPGALEEVARLAADWFMRYLPDEAKAG